MVKENKKSIMEQKYECKFCGVKFHKETTLSTHMCVKKRRHMEIDTTGSRIGFRVFQRFYEINVNSKKVKTTDEFIESSYYIDFVKFGHHVAQLKPVYTDQFIDYVIRSGIKLKDWCQDVVYYTYIEELVKKEPPDSAVERTITEIMEWTEKNQVDFNLFFHNIMPGEAVHLIKTGRISPWVLYLCSSSELLMNKFSEEQGIIIGNIIDPGFWMKKFKKNPDDVEYIRNILEQAGI